MTISKATALALAAAVTAASLSPAAAGTGRLVDGLQNAHVSDLAKRGFNPQPEPPAYKTLAPQIGVNPAAKYGFNPQPEPPPAPALIAK